MRHLTTCNSQEKRKLNKLHALLRELYAYKKAYNEQKIVFFRPLPQGDQKAFFAGQEAVVRVVLGSNRSGKTACGAVEAIAHMLGFRPWLPKDHPLRTVRLPGGVPIPVPNVGRIIAQNYTQAIDQTIMQKFNEWLPRFYVKRIRNNNKGVPVSIELTNKSIVYLMTDDQDDMAFEGPFGHWFWGDEPFGNRKYTGLKRGLVDHNGHCWLTLTPLDQPWIKDTLVDRAGDPGSGVELYKFSIWDNCVENGGYLERAAIESFLSDIKEDELEARLHGEFLHLAGRVYKTWKPQEPFWMPPIDLPDTWPRAMFADPHSKKPLCMMWVAFSPSGRKYVYRAVEDPSIRTVHDAANFIKHVENWENEPEPVALRIIDWSAEEVERTSGTSIRRLFGEEGLFFVKAEKHNAAAGYDAIHEALKMKYEWDTPELVVFNTCPAVKKNFMNFCYDEWATSRLAERKGPKEGYNSKDDDFIDMIRYMYQHRLTYHMLSSILRRKHEEEEDTYDLAKNTIYGRDGTRTGYGGLSVVQGNRAAFGGS